uniref:Uncharacterized protein n=1 Tax=Nonomuraea gerenzanensis TaxID=93944 RepID=A0A1M4DYQ7_9ACTN|nr:hypothetical protein BN4615_P1218 [Nonomuraea gerenzanensis]
MGAREEGAREQTLPRHSQRIAQPGACGKTPVVPQNQRPRPPPRTTPDRSRRP